MQREGERVRWARRKGGLCKFATGFKTDLDDAVMLNCESGLTTQPPFAVYFVGRATRAL